MVILEKLEDNNLEKCSLCNFCRPGCPVFYSTKIEGDSPRSKAIKIKLDKVDEEFFKCALCGFCESACPNEVDFNIVGWRDSLNKDGYETEANKKMIENVRKYGNPFGEIRDYSKDDELYYC